MFLKHYFNIIKIIIKTFLLYLKITLNKVLKMVLKHYFNILKIS